MLDCLAAEYGYPVCDMLAWSTGRTMALWGLRCMRLKRQEWLMDQQSGKTLARRRETETDFHDVLRMIGAKPKPYPFRKKEAHVQAG